MNILHGVLITLFLLFLVVISPILIPLYLFSRLVGWINEAKFRRYLRSTPDAKYFCYTNRSNSKAFVEDCILPALPPDVAVIYVTDNLFNLGDDVVHGHDILAKMGLLKKGFPCLAKAIDGDLEIKSINSAVYRSIVRKKGIDRIVADMTRFYQS